MSIEPFVVQIPEEDLAELRVRIRQTRWPDEVPEIGWAQGTPVGYLRGLLDYWADGFDWPARQRALNEFAHFRADLDGAPIHFVHEMARDGRGIALILSHGWPSSFVEYLPLVPLLTDPQAHGLDGPSFDVVIPSLPGYGFSARPAGGARYRDTAARWHRLMRSLGYHRYGAHGGDFGAGIATYMALDEPGPLLGIHLSNLEIAPYTGPGSPPLTAAEQAYLAANQGWAEAERGYSAIQSSKPQTLGYGLTDSPAGLAAWICEKWRSWTDSGGDLDARFGRDYLLTVLTIYWATRTITSSMRDYYDNRWTGVAIGPDDRIGVPTGIAVFDHEFVPEGEPPREWAQRLYDVRRWTRMPRGGHFAPVEEPMLLAQDLAAFFGGLAR